MIQLELVFPTQVGVIPCFKFDKGIDYWIPHASGGDPGQIVAAINTNSYSPRKWG